MEQVLDWLNENELRAYPLLDSADKSLLVNSSLWWSLPDNLLLDLQLITSYYLTADGTPLSKIHTYLKRIVHTAGNVTVHFYLGGTDTSSQLNTALEVTSFEVTNAAWITYPVYVRNPDGCLAVFGEGLRDFVNKCAGNSITIETDIPTEPSVYTQFDGPWLGVNSISTAPEKLSEFNKLSPQLPLAPKQTKTTLAGDVQLIAGYNFKVDISIDNLIDLEISSSYGLRMDCSTSFIAPQYLDCDEFVYYINGLAPDEKGNFRLNAGTNINITTGNTLDTFYDPFANQSLSEESNSHTLFVGLNFKVTDVCAPVNITPHI